MTSGDVRFGFLGAGWIARTALAPAVHAARGAVLQAAAARDRDRARSLQPAGRSYGGPDAYRALLGDPEVDVVYLSLHNSAHRGWVLAALEAGKHVLCEKPMAMAAAELAELTAAADQADRLLVEAFWYRWHPRTRRLAALVTAGDLGRITAVDADFSFDAPDADLVGNYRLDPAAGGGALYDTGCYAVSAAHLLLGPDLTVERAAAVTGPTGVDLSASATLRADLSASATLRADLSASATLRADRSNAGERSEAVLRCAIQGSVRQALRVTGTAASARLLGSDGREGEAFTSWQAEAALRIDRSDGARPERFEERFEPVDAYRLMVEAMAARVRGEDAFLVGLDHCGQVTGTLDAIRTAWPTPLAPPF
jgi:D-xylose 1-dehydrogenase (NADP+, D-xylono-1,5-lactone-forming)